jgi:dTDP-glucose 4,6-dehydratase
MRYLVTGGLGFIGSHFIENLLEDDLTESIINIDVCTYAANKAFRPADPRYKFWEEDIGNVDSLRQLDSSFDVVVNFASHSHVDNSIDNPTAFIKNNILGFFNFLNMCSEWHQTGRLGKFIHISTDEVFGDVADSIYSYFVEKSDLCPSSPYSASKASQEMFIHTARKMFDLKANILRFCNNYGPRQFEEKFIPVIIKNVLKNNRIPVYGDGSQEREWIYVKDAVQRIKMVALNADDDDDYCVGSGESQTNLDIIKAINNLTGKHPESNVEFVADRVGHDKIYKMDSRKFNYKYNLYRNKELTPLTEGLRHTFEYFEKPLSYPAIPKGHRD